MDIPEEIFYKILLYVPTRYPFLKNIREYNKKPIYSIIRGGIYHGLLSIRILDKHGYTFDIIDPYVDKIKHFNVLA